MLGLITDKIKGVILWVALAAAPLLFMLGTIRGSRSSQIKGLEKDVAKQRDITDFYREMEQFNAEDNRPRNRDDLIEQLRKHKF